MYKRKRKEDCILQLSFVITQRQCSRGEVIPVFNQISYSWQNMFYYLSSCLASFRTTGYILLLSHDKGHHLFAVWAIHLVLLCRRKVLDINSRLHSNCHSWKTNNFAKGFMSWNGICEVVGSRCLEIVANSSALLLPRITIWLGTQQHFMSWPSRRPHCTLDRTRCTSLFLLPFTKCGEYTLRIHE